MVSGPLLHFSHMSLDLRLNLQRYWAQPMWPVRIPDSIGLSNVIKGGTGRLEACGKMVLK